MELSDRLYGYRKIKETYLMITEPFQYKNWSEILEKCLIDLGKKYPNSSETAVASEIGLTPGHI